MIEKLKWDSSFFGYPVGKLEVEDDDVFTVTEELHNYQLVYVFSKKKIEPLHDHMNEVDIKTTLTKQISPDGKCPFHKSIEEYKGEDDDSLKRLALESGVYSRFNTDKNFKNSEFERLYTAWIENSITKKDADNLLVFKEEGIIKGFITLKFKDGHSNIGLIAVHNNHRGKGIGLALLYAAFYQTERKGLPLISVVTQFENVPAMKMYSKAGFEIVETIHVYHIWNKP
jgi:dTDP-4-amino-4,6-dideoxy-D-galactose acyltransferase